MQKNNRRRFLQTGAAVAAASAISQTSAAPPAGELYLYGLVWNRSLSGDLGNLLVKLSVRVRFAASGITGFGTLGDDVLAGINSHFEVKSVTLVANHLTITGKVIHAINAANIGVDVQLEGDIATGFSQPLTLRFASSVFTGAGVISADQYVKLFGDGSVK